jgi:hypothetical protein
VEHLVGNADLRKWRGELDYWLFADGEVGRVAGSISGVAAAIADGRLQGTLRARMTVTDRDREHVVLRPTP